MSPEPEESAPRLTRVYQVGPVHQGMRGDAFLVLMVPFLSRTRLRQKIQSGDCLLNGRRFGAANRLRDGDRIELTWTQSAPPDPPPVLVILHEDEDIVVLDKPAGLAVHPTGRKQGGTLVHGLLERYRPQIEQSIRDGDPSFYPGIVNRLDLFTSGVVLFGKRKAMTARMHRRIGGGEVAKRYIALVRGVVAGVEGEIDLPLGRDPVARIRLKQAVIPEGLPSVTRWRVLERLPAHTLVEAIPVTGRQHQIRVHFAALGHPVWGDLLYQDDTLFLRYLDNGCRPGPGLPPRHCLHAATLSFRHPRTDEPLEITSPLPADFQAILAAERTVRPAR